MTIDQQSPEQELARLRAIVADIARFIARALDDEANDRQELAENVYAMLCGLTVSNPLGDSMLRAMRLDETEPITMLTADLAYAHCFLCKAIPTFGEVSMTTSDDRPRTTIRRYECPNGHDWEHWTEE
jgi:hypothetical protein